MKLRVHDNGKDIRIQIWDEKKYTYRNVAGPYKDDRNARVGLKHYRKYNNEDFDTRVGRQVMALKNWGDVKL